MSAVIALQVPDELHRLLRDGHIVTRSPSRSLKYDLADCTPFEDLEGARLRVYKFIESFYNSRHPHQTLHYRSINRYEA